MISSPWFFVPRPLPNPRLRLLMLPHAGGSPPAFRGWDRRVPAGVELWLAHPPGRGARLREPVLARSELLVDSLMGALRPHLGTPLVLMGHSFGARFALALAHRLRALGQPPRALIVSSRRGPRVPSREPDLHPLPQAAFLRELERRYGALDEALRHSELAEMLFPALQADLRASETWPAEAGPPLDLPLHVRGGRDDATVAEADLQAWRAESTGLCSVELLPGGHFYLLQDPAPFFASLEPAFASLLATA